jgi:FAD/FMN-containing dehydrogenase
MASLTSRKKRERSKSNAAPKMGASRGVGKRLLRAGRFLGIAVLSLLVFGVIVSAIAFVRVPSVTVGAMRDSSVQVNEVTRLYPVTMARVVTPTTVDEISSTVRSSPGPISIGGGRYSMGGQTATPDGLQLDMRNFRGVIAFDSIARTITVRSGTRWREVQQAIDPAGLAVKIMQTYDNFTVGGALSVNAHGRYIGQGPLIRSVREITLVLADGRVVTASPTVNPELFYGAIGGYGALGVIADVTLDLAIDSRVRRDDEKMSVASYPGFFRRRVRNDTSVIFHNADIYPPAYENIHAVSYRLTSDPVTVADRLKPQDQGGWIHRAAYSMITGGGAGHWTREHVIDPVIFLGQPVTWRNYEASYDVSELEPESREKETYVLQEYFIPVDSFSVFLPRMRRILRSHDVNAVNVSVRHALPDPGSFLAWAPDEVFAFVLYYKQGTDPDAKREVGKWTRELIGAAIQSGGRYYLPYQPVATRAQFALAYPGAKRLFDLKRRVDPANKFTNTLWDLYEPAEDGPPPTVSASRMPAVLPAEARIVLDTMRGYTREESDEYITHPEWDLVYGSEAYARWLASVRRPSGFPYVGSVGTFWRSYYGAWRAGRTRYSFGAGRHVMLGVIGVSTAIEYGLKGLYENSIGRLSELDMPAGGTAEDRYAAGIAADYSRLISQRGWYEFDFAGALENLWTDVPLFGPGPLRKWERRLALSAEYSIKTVYAALIGFGTKSAYSADELTRYVVVAGWSDSLRTSGISSTTALAELKPVVGLDRGYTLLAVRRYNPFRDALLALADRADKIRLAELSGSEVVTFSGTAPAGWLAPPRTVVVVAYVDPADPPRRRILLRVAARDLLDVLRRLRLERKFVVEHIYDY